MNMGSWTIHVHVWHDWHGGSAGHDSHTQIRKLSLTRQHKQKVFRSVYRSRRFLRHPYSPVVSLAHTCLFPLQVSDVVGEPKLEEGSRSPVKMLKCQSFRLDHSDSHMSIKYSSDFQQTMTVLSNCSYQIVPRNHYLYIHD